MAKETKKAGEVLVSSANAVDTHLLINFYNQAFPKRKDFFCEHWKWINRTAYLANKVPLVALFNNKVIAHAGIVPVDFNVNENTLLGSWFIDLAVLPQFRKQGLGKYITKKWMEIGDLQLAIFCSEKSIAVLKSHGWTKINSSHLNICVTAPFSHPRFAKRTPKFLRSVLNRISYPFLISFYKKYAYKDISERIIEVNEKSINDFIRLYNVRETPANAISPVRNKDFFSWRILNSPDKKKYVIYKGEKFSAIILIQTQSDSHIDVLCVSDINNKEEIRNMICSLSVFAMKKRISRVRFYTNNFELSEYLKKTTSAFVRQPLFAAFAKSKQLNSKLNNVEWRLELIDGNCEYAY